MRVKGLEGQVSDQGLWAGRARVGSLVGHREAPRVPCDLCLHSQERIHCLEGTHEFFEAIGFQKVLLPIPDQGKSPELGREGPVRGLPD